MLDPRTKDQLQCQLKQLLALILPSHEPCTSSFSWTFPRPKHGYLLRSFCPALRNFRKVQFTPTKFLSRNFHHEILLTKFPHEILLTKFLHEISLTKFLHEISLTKFLHEIFLTKFLHEIFDHGLSSYLVPCLRQQHSLCCHFYTQWKLVLPHCLPWRHISQVSPAKSTPLLAESCY